MKKNKFISLYVLLSKKEKQEFAWYLRAQLHEANKFHDVVSHLQKTPQKRLERYISHLDTFPTDIFATKSDAENPLERQHKSLLNAFDELNAHLKAFLLGPVSGNAESKWRRELRWVSILNARGLQKEGAKTLADLYDMMSASPRQNFTQCLDSLLIAQQYQQLLIASMPDKKADAFVACNQLLANLNLVVDYKFACDILNWCNVQKLDTSEYVDITRYVKLTPKQSEFKLLVLYRAAFEMLISQEVEDFNEFKEKFNECAPDLDRSELGLFVRFMDNSASKLARLGKKEAGKSQHLLHVKAAEMGVYRLFPVINGVFGNVINVAVVNGAYAWADMFIQQHVDVFPSDQRDKMERLAKAIIADSQDNYQGVVDNLRGVAFPFSNNMLRLKMLLSWSACKLGYLEIVLEAERALLRAVKGHKKTDAIESAKLFCNIVKHIAQRKKSPSKLREMIDAAQHLYRKDELLKAVDTYRPL